LLRRRANDQGRLLGDGNDGFPSGPPAEEALRGPTGQNLASGGEKRSKFDLVFQKTTPFFFKKGPRTLKPPLGEGTPFSGGARDDRIFEDKGLPLLIDLEVPSPHGTGQGTNELLVPSEILYMTTMMHVSLAENTKFCAQ